MPVEVLECGGDDAEPTVLISKVGAVGMCRSPECLAHSDGLSKASGYFVVGVKVTSHEKEVRALCGEAPGQ
jgi:hypothetical protein